MTSKGQRRLGELRWRDRVARSLRVVIGVGECQRTPTPAHVPLDVVGHHAEEKRSAHPIGRAMVSGRTLRSTPSTVRNTRSTLLSAL